MEFVEIRRVQAEGYRDDSRLLWETAGFIILNYMELDTCGHSALRGVNFI